jgi:hypothetical protein
VACASFKEDDEDARRSEVDIRGELHVESHVSFRMISGTMGKRLIVNVSLTSPPAGDSSALKARVDDIVVREFRAQVERTNVTF